MMGVMAPVTAYNYDGCHGTSNSTLKVFPKRKCGCACKGNEVTGSTFQVVHSTARLEVRVCCRFLTCKDYLKTSIRMTIFGKLLIIFLKK